MEGRLSRLPAAFRIARYDYLTAEQDAEATVQKCVFCASGLEDAATAPTIIIP